MLRKLLLGAGRNVSAAPSPVGRRGRAKIECLRAIEIFCDLRPEDLAALDQTTRTLTLCSLPSA